MRDVNWTYCGLNDIDHFVIYPNIESLCCILETYTALYVNSISIKRRKKDDGQLAETRKAGGEQSFRV